MFRDLKVVYSVRKSVRTRTIKNETGQKPEIDQALKGFVCLANTFEFYDEILGESQEDF